MRARITVLCPWAFWRWTWRAWKRDCSCSMWITHPRATPGSSRRSRRRSSWKLMGLEVDWVGMERIFKDVGLPPQIPGMAMRGSLPIMVGNVQVGYSSTSTWSPLLKKYIALAHLQKPYFELGTDVRMEITVEHHRHHAPAKVVKLPFYE